MKNHQSIVCSIVAAFLLASVLGGCATEPLLNEELTDDFGDKLSPVEDETRSKAPAPNLYYLEAYAVISSDYPQYEYVSNGQFSTLQNHGGAELYIVTAELGYISWGQATMNGVPLQEVQNQPIFLTYPTIEGWYRWWDASGSQGGSFNYGAQSINVGPYMSDSLYVQ